MSTLFRHLRVHQIFGANTDVGKTILTTALVNASVSKNIPVFYLKPVSTGALQDADDGHVKRFVKSKLVQTDCLFRYNEPVSPHLAAKLKVQDNDTLEIPSDQTVVNSIASRIRRYANQKSSSNHAHVYLETAGGVHSPSLTGTTQAECYRPLFLPTVLIGDYKLGGISSTISSYESLLLRGYIIDAVLLFRDEYYRNWEYLQPYFAEKGIHVAAIDLPPSRLSDLAADGEALQNYYSGLVLSSVTDGINGVLDHLDVCHMRRMEELDSMPRRSLDTIWWPFVQHGLVKSDKDVTVIDSAHSDFFSVYRPSESEDRKSNDTSSLLVPEFDSSASWWTQTFGHAHTSLTLAAARASGRYGHVMFPQATHLPALKLAEKMVYDGPGKGWASRAFFSDNGSTAMEVALKMALRAYASKNNVNTSNAKKLGVLGLKGSYHGDTIGTMNACAEGVYSCEWHEAKGYWLDPPHVGIKNGKPGITLTPALQALVGETVLPAPSIPWIYDVEERLQTPIAKIYRQYIEKTVEVIGRDGQQLGALVIEPLLMGAGGMIFVDPLYQRVLVDAVRGRHSTDGAGWSGLPVIYDEVFIGLYRVGVESSGPIIGAYPDISVNAKVLTGGLVPMSITLASESIYNTFLGDTKATALLHGHSYTAHPIGCEVANETLKMIDSLKSSKGWQLAQASWNERASSHGTVWSFWDPGFIQAISKQDRVEDVMALGCVLAIKVRSGDAGYVSMSAQSTFESLKTTIPHLELSPAPGGAPFTTHYRTLGDVAYFMTSLNTHPSLVRAMEDKIWQVLKDD